jgi:hypothetical protein
MNSMYLKIGTVIVRRADRGGDAKTKAIVLTDPYKKYDGPLGNQGSYNLVQKIHYEGNAIPHEELAGELLEAFDVVKVPEIAKVLFDETT